MGKKKNGNEKGIDGEENKEKGSSSSTFVFKLDCLCEGCAIKIFKCIHQFQGVETVKTENSTNKLTVIGAVDSAAIKEKLEKKTKKKVDLISPQPNKNENKSDKNKNEGSDNNNKKAEKKPKEVPVTTADLRVQLKCQCQGCIVKIRKIISDTNGVHELKVDKVKEVVTVKGTMDVKALAEALKQKLKKNVEIVAPKKEKDGKKEGGENGGGGNDGGGGTKKNKGGNGGAGDGGNGANTDGGGTKKNKGGNGGAGDGGNDANADGGGTKKNKGGTGDGGNGANADGGVAVGKMEGNRMEVMVQPQFGYMPGYPGYGHPGYGYGYGQQHQQGHGYPGYVPGYPVSVHPPHHMFNDENPNACAIM